MKASQGSTPQSFSVLICGTKGGFLPHQNASMKQWRNGTRSLFALSNIYWDRDISQKKPWSSLSLHLMSGKKTHLWKKTTFMDALPHYLVLEMKMRSKLTVHLNSFSSKTEVIPVHLPLRLKLQESPMSCKYSNIASSVQFSRSVLSDSLWPHGLRTPGVPVYHQLPELIQIYVHHVSDAIQPSHPLSAPSPPTFNLSQHQGLFQWVSSSHQVAKLL